MPHVSLYDSLSWHQKLVYDKFTLWCKRYYSMSFFWRSSSCKKKGCCLVTDNSLYASWAGCYSKLRVGTGFGAWKLR